MSRFKSGDKLVPVKEGKKLLLSDSKRKIEDSMKSTGKPYLVVDYIRSYDSWIIFNEQPMRKTSYEGEPNAWNPDYWTLFKEPIALDDTLFTI